jgi:hypothetical protein
MTDVDRYWDRLAAGATPLEKADDEWRRPITAVPLRRELSAESTFATTRSKLTWAQAKKRRSKSVFVSREKRGGARVDQGRAVYSDRVCAVEWCTNSLRKSNKVGVCLEHLHDYKYCACQTCENRRVKIAKRRAAVETIS